MNYSNNMATKIYFNRDDYKIPLVYPTSGIVTDDIFDRLIEILCEEVFPFSPYKQNVTYAEIVKGFTNKRLLPIDHIRNKMNKEKFAVVTNRFSGYTRVDFSKRVCHRHTFGPEIVSIISNLLSDFIFEQVNKKSNVLIDDLKIDPSHGDILYYEEGGVFEIHRDSLNKFPFGTNEVDEYGFKKWNMYTLLICLDSNITPQNLHRGDGNTTVYLPEQTFLQHIVRLGGISEDFFLGYEISYYPTPQNFKHSFSESCEKSKFLLFPAEAKHASIKIMQEKGYKMALKMDVWLKRDHNYNYRTRLTPTQLIEAKDGSVEMLPEYMTEKPKKDKQYLYHYLKFNSPHCSCNKCNPLKLKKKIYHKNLNKIIKTLNFNVCGLITEFVIGIDKPDNRLFHSVNKSNNCTCHNCIKLHIYDPDILEESDYDYDYEDRYDDCNGYCDY